MPLLVMDCIYTQVVHKYFFMQYIKVYKGLASSLHFEFGTTFIPSK